MYKQKSLDFLVAPFIYKKVNQGIQDYWEKLLKLLTLRETWGGGGRSGDEAEYSHPPLPPPRPFWSFTPVARTP